jgi:transposase
MSQRRRKFSLEYRQEAVKMVTDGPRPIAQVARELGLNEGTLGKLGKHLEKKNTKTRKHR